MDNDPNLNNIPSALRAIPRWVCWRFEDRGGKLTKPPLNPNNGSHASCKDSTTWSDFGTAVNACERYGFSGIGFVFGDDRQFTGVDLDHVIDDEGRVLPEYQWIVDEVNTYMEVSPSGDGLHLIFKGPKPQGMEKCKRDLGNGVAVEMYDHDRYFTVTGFMYNDHAAMEVSSQPDLLARIYQTYFADEDALTTPDQLSLSLRSPNNTAMSLADDDVIGIMMRSQHGLKIQALMSGDTTAYDGDDSAADLALCNYLAFYTNRDADQMDRIFRTTGLMRPKWDEMHGAQTYGQLTIQKALEGMTDSYGPTGLTASATNRIADALYVYDAWMLDSMGRLFKRGTARNDPDWKLITSTPPYLAASVRDVDTGIVRSLVQMNVNGQQIEKLVDRDDILSSTKIVSTLSPLGANISSANAKDVVAYLTHAESAYGIPSLAGVSHMGWQDGLFMPFDQDNPSLRFDPPADAADIAKCFMEPRGTLKEWLAGIAPARDKSMAFRAILAASFASPLIRVLGLQPFIVYLWGDSRSGKTPSLKAAGSIWGNPSEGANSYYRTFGDTPKSTIRLATFLHDVPIIIDELQSKGAMGGQKGKRQSVEDLLYSLSLGHERAALNSDRSMMDYGSWRSLTIATGEIPILSGETQQGAQNRTLELNAEPFDNAEEASEMHRFVAGHYGSAGRAFIKSLQAIGFDELRKWWTSFRADAIRLIGENPQRENIALLGFAEALAECFLLSTANSWEIASRKGYELCAWLSRNTARAIERNTDRAAIEFIAEWLAANNAEFGPGTNWSNRYGIREDSRNESIYYVLSNVLRTALESKGFDDQKTLRRMKREGIISTGETGFTKQKRMGNAKPRCVVINLEALNRFLDDGCDSDESPLEGERRDIVETDNPASELGLF